VLLVSGAALYFTLSGTGSTRPTLSLITYTPSGKEKTLAVTTDVKQKTSELSSTVTARPPIKAQTPIMALSPDSTPSPQCELASPLKLLYINTGKDGERFTSQAVRMVYINPSDKSADFVAFPCDLWVSTPSLVKDYTISAIRLCSLIQLVKNAPGNKNIETSIADVINTVINDNFQIKSDGFILTSTDSLMKSVDLVKNIEVISPETVTISAVQLQKGSNQIDSSAIFSLFSMTGGQTDPWQSMDRQDAVLAGLYNASQSTSTGIKNLISNAQTNLQDQELSSLQCTLKDSDPTNFKFTSIFKDNTSTAEDGSITMTDMAKIMGELKNIFK